MINILGPFWRETNRNAYFIIIWHQSLQSPLGRNKLGFKPFQASRPKIPKHLQTFPKIAVLPSMQNCYKCLFSMVVCNTGAFCQNMKVKTLERKVEAGGAILKHRLLFHCKTKHKQQWWGWLKSLHDKALSLASHPIWSQLVRLSIIFNFSS